MLTYINVEDINDLCIRFVYFMFVLTLFVSIHNTLVDSHTYKLSYAITLYPSSVRLFHSFSSSTFSHSSNLSLERFFHSSIVDSDLPQPKSRYTTFKCAHKTWMNETGWSYTIRHTPCYVSVCLIRCDSSNLFMWQTGPYIQWNYM